MRLEHVLAEHRRRERTTTIPHSLDEVEIRTGDLSIPARVLDISSEGFGIEMSVPIAIPPRGSELRLHFPRCGREIRATLAHAERKAALRLGLYVNKLEDRTFLESHLRQS